VVLTAVREKRETYRLPNARTSDKRPTTNGVARPATPGPKPVLSEAKEPLPFTLTEADLSTLWAGQRFPAAALVTRAGAPVRVLHPGRAGRGAGPDFRDAILDVPSGAVPNGGAPAGGVLRGDVELHVRASDFRTHGHERDHRYDRVVLHVVFEDDADEETLLACGRRVAVVALAPWVRRRAHELSGWLAAPRLWREPCHDAIARLGPEAVLKLLDELGEQRFRERAVALVEQIQRLGPAEALFRALLEGLGYGGNTTLMAQISGRAAWSEISAMLEASRPDAHAIEALLVTSAGSLLEGHTGRPANHPARRISGLAALVVRQRMLFINAPDLSLLELSPGDLIVAFTVAPLIGRSRAIELLTNAALPWAAALASTRDRSDLLAEAFARYTELPRPARYGALGFLETNLRNGDKPLAINARRQQGLLTLYKSECTQGGCGRCALS